MDKNPQKPRLADLLNDHFDSKILNSYFSMPGKIDSYDAATQTAQIEIMISRVLDDPPGATSNYPALVDVPVFQLSGAKGGVNMPIAAGDPCLLIFADRDIDSWFATGATNPPATLRAHEISDAFALVGVRPLTNLTIPPDATATSLYNNVTQVAIKNDKVNVSNGTASLLARLQQLVADINTSLASISVNNSTGTISTSLNTCKITSTSETYTPVATDFTGLLY